MFWRIQRFWGHDPRFNFENFAFQPLYLIYQALEWADKLEKEVLFKQELGVASLSALFANANRDPKSDPFKPQQFCHWLPEVEAEKRIPAAACDAFFSLINDGLMPAWAVPLCPIEQLKSNSINAPVKRPRALIGEGVLLLVPEFVGRVVTAQFALIDGVEGVIDLKDPDTGKWHAVELPREDCWIIEAEFPLIESKLIL